ncbi:equilibrative nucleobase transporter 1-like [Rhinoraja longicauda]
MEKLGDRVKRYLTFATGVIECFGFAGIILGWPSLVFVLKTKEYFADLCLSVQNSSDSGAANATDKYCDMQDERFTLIFTIASFVMPVATIANGFLLDYCGTMATRLLAIFLYTMGNLMIAFSTNASSALLFPAISLLGVGGLLLFITNVQVGNLFGSKRSTVITVYNGALDSSAVVFLIFKVRFLTHLLWFSLIQLRLILFIGTVNPMLNFLSNSDPGQVSRFTNALGITQLCGILCAPCNGLILDRHKRRNKRLDRTPGTASSERLADMQSALLSLAITVTLSVLFSVCAAIPVPEVQYLTFVLQMVNRAFLYGGLSAFIVIAFPQCHFGKLFGTMQALAAIVSLLHYPCFILVNGPLQNNPLYLNIALIVIVTCTFAHPINVYFYCRRENNTGTGEATAGRNAGGELSLEC